MNKQPDLRQPVDDEVRRLAKTLLRSARQAALGTLDAASGAPSVSRVVLATFASGEPGFFISALAGHTRNLLVDARCSLLVGEPGKGDPLAHPRMTLIGSAVRLGEGAVRDAFRARYRNKNAKSRLYDGLPDFSYWMFVARAISLNGGFGRAYDLDPNDLKTALPEDGNWTAIETGIVAHMNDDLPDVVDRLAARAGRTGPDWRMASLDPEGVDLVRGDEIARLWFSRRLTSTDEIEQTLAGLASE